jgi:phosphoserine phosphatase RsbU/P
MNRHYKILIADDSTAILRSVKEMLLNDKAGKYYVLKAIDGKQAVHMTLLEHPDLILIDIEMPVMNGIEAIRIIRNTESTKEIPIIVMSATRAFEDAFSAGADDFLIKPFNQYELLLRIHLNIQLIEKAKIVKKQNEILKVQKQEATFQRDTIAKQQKEFIDDLNYASFIQSAIMPSYENIKGMLKDFFIFNRPKNKVSGDFYWVIKKEEKIIIALGDCTGHGLSGALMSMAGMAILNETINKAEHLSPSLILNEMRSQVIKLLHQKGSIGEASNGMDLAICIIDPETRVLKYAGANNPIYIVRHDLSLEVLKADRMPVGIHINHEHPFTEKEAQLDHKDMLYLFTDGYADQFGGPLSQKFRYDKFKELLVGISDLDSEEQNKILENTFVNWIGNFEQIDDILIIGIRCV